MRKKFAALFAAAFGVLASLVPVYAGDDSIAGPVFWLLIGSGVLIVAAVVLGVLGAVFVARGIAGYVQSKGILTLGEAGLYWKESGNAAAERFFLKWEVIESVRYETIQDKRFIVVQCSFGAFHLPDIAGAYEAIDAAKPGICA